MTARRPCTAPVEPPPVWTLAEAGSWWAGVAHRPARLAARVQAAVDQLVADGEDDLTIRALVIAAAADRDWLLGSARDITAADREAAASSAVGAGPPIVLV